MARVAITEYAAKRLCFGDDYVGVTVTQETVNSTVESLLEGQTYVVKVDTGVKKRGKQGLLAVDVSREKVVKTSNELLQKGYDRVLVEPFFKHDASAEQYLSLTLTRDGTQLLHAKQGGVDVEEGVADITQEVIPPDETAAGQVSTTSLPGVPLNELLVKMQAHHFSFLEINPYVVVANGDFMALDMAVEIDSAKENKLPEWAKEHVLHKPAVSEAEQAVLEQDARTQAALNLHTLNPDGSILTLFSGGGASLVALDSLVTAGLQEQVINYSEYSGAPTRDETAEYVRTLLGVLFNSAAKNKVILIAGGVANFTDVMATFQGIVDAFSERVDMLKKHNVYVCVRRGGPNQEAGLAHLRDWLNEQEIPHDVHDPSLSLGEVGKLVKQHL